MRQGRRIAVRPRGWNSKAGGRAGAILAAALFALPAPASAQGLLGAIFGGLFGGGPPRQRYYAPPPPPVYGDPYGAPRGERAEPGTRGGGGGRMTFCVRLCDGRYFPLTSGVSSADAAELCNAMCPATPAKVFYGSLGAMEHAVGRDGSRYASLPTAFAFRERLVSDCSCKADGDPLGTARIDLQHDPTLKRGDVVATDTGGMIYQGVRARAGTAEFTPIENFDKVAADLRQKLATNRPAEAD